MKRLLFTFFAVMCCMMMAKAAEFTENGITYNVTSDNTVEVILAPFKNAIVIPATVTYDDVTYSVTSIGDWAFKNCILTSIALPNSLESIGENAFRDCPVLTSVTIPGSVTSIGGFAFENCQSLASVIIQDGVKSIGEEAFRNCPVLTSITIPNSVMYIRNSAFEGCTGLTSISLPENLDSIFNAAFSGCTGLTSVTIPSKVKSIGRFAFSGTTNLKEVFVYSDSLTSVDEAGVWSKEIPTYVKATSFKNYKGNLFKSYNVKVLPDDGNIGDALKGEFNFSEEEAEVINRLLSIRSTMGTKQEGPAIEVTDQDGKVLKLYNPKKVNFIKVTTNE